MSAWQLWGLAPEDFDPLFQLSDEVLHDRGIVRRQVTHQPGFPCRLRLADAAPGEEVLLLHFEYHDTTSPYRASGPIFIGRSSGRVVLPPGVIPPYVSRRRISLRAYDRAGFMTDGVLCEGADVGAQLDRQFVDPAVHYVQLHNAARGCYSCEARRCDALAEAC